MMDDMSIDTFINEIRLRPAIWDTTDYDYKNKQLKREKWDEICSIYFPDYLDLDYEIQERVHKEMFDKWRHVRDNFVRYLRIQHNRAKQRRKPLKKYVHAHHLQFLLPTVNFLSQKAKEEEDYTLTVQSSPERNHDYCDVETDDTTTPMITKASSKKRICITNSSMELEEGREAVQSSPEMYHEYCTEDTDHTTTPEISLSKNSAKRRTRINDESESSPKVYRDNIVEVDNTTPATMLSKKYKRRTRISSLATSLRELQELSKTLTEPLAPRGEDEFDLIGKYIAVQLRKLPADKMLNANLEIQQILVKYLFENMEKRCHCAHQTVEESSETLH